MRVARGFHASNADGSAHVVKIENLQVLISRHEHCWFAQGLEIDYGVEGTDIDDVRRAFEYGLAATIAVHLREFGDLSRLLRRPAPTAVWESLETGGIRARYSQLSAHVFPFQIQFLEAA
jgi:hypothetical protein